MSVEYGIITSIMPPSGWHYPQALASGDTVRLTAFTFEQILETMLDFRRRHLELCGGALKATIEAVRSDLKDYLCKHFRQNCADSPGPAYSGASGIGVSKSMLYSPPINKAADWLAKIGGIQTAKVDVALASQRAAICAQCPMNVGWQTPCQPCNENISIRLQNAKGSVHTPYDRSLLVCRVYGWTNEVAVWLTDGHATSEQKPPSHCWKVQEEQHGIR